MEDTLRTITDYVKKTCPHKLEEGQPVELLAVDRVFDSIAMMDFLAFLERAFQIRISDADVLPANFADFTAVARLVSSKKDIG
jgi:acyl carrier protein